VAVKIRLMRVGKKKQPTYRVVVADGRSPRDGRNIETIGQYRPREEPSFVQLDGDKALHWLRKGAQPTEQVQKLLQIVGVWETFQSEKGPKAKAAPKRKTGPAKSAPEAAAPAAATAEAAPETEVPAEESAE
jgi:small subunit ribosomal protein S16